MLKFIKKEGKRGFTLIELLVVIAIIGILASVVLASLNSARRKSRDSRRLADVQSLKVALELYFDANSGGYPLTLSALTGATACGTSNCISVVPVPPTGASQTAYAYAALGSGSSCTSYHLGANMEEATNPAMSSDADASGGTVCTNGGTEFLGLSTDCATTAAAVGTETCYDVKP